MIAKAEGGRKGLSSAFKRSKDAPPSQVVTKRKRSALSGIDAGHSRVQSAQSSELVQFPLLPAQGAAWTLANKKRLARSLPGLNDKVRWPIAGIAFSPENIASSICAGLSLLHVFSRKREVTRITALENPSPYSCKRFVQVGAVARAAKAGR